MQTAHLTNSRVLLGITDVGPVIGSQQPMLTGYLKNGAECVFPYPSENGCFSPTAERFICLHASNCLILILRTYKMGAERQHSTIHHRTHSSYKKDVT